MAAIGRPAHIAVRHVASVMGQDPRRDAGGQVEQAQIAQVAGMVGGRALGRVISDRESIGRPCRSAVAVAGVDAAQEQVVIGPFDTDDADYSATSSAGRFVS